jgi:hypothetical protein
VYAAINSSHPEKKIAGKYLCHVVLMNRRFPAADLLSLAGAGWDKRTKSTHHTIPSHPPDEFLSSAHTLHTSPSVENSM